MRGRPHLRVENRVLPAGPTVVDTLANAAFYYGLVRVLVDDERPIWSRDVVRGGGGQLPLGRPATGIDARLYWPGVGEAPAAELVLRRLLPMARDGLARWGVDAGDADRLLEIVERRCVLGVNGASWQAAAFHRLYDRLDRAGRPARDDRPLPRAHALQRAGPHLAAPSKDPDTFSKGV